MAQLSVEPLPPAATQLAVPLTSLLPFISVHDGTKHQVTTQLIKSYHRSLLERREELSMLLLVFHSRHPGISTAC